MVLVGRAGMNFNRGVGFQLVLMGSLLLLLVSSTNYTCAQGLATVVRVGRAGMNFYRAVWSSLFCKKKRKESAPGRNLFRLRENNSLRRNFTPSKTDPLKETQISYRPVGYSTAKEININVFLGD